MRFTLLTPVALLATLGLSAPITDAANEAAPAWKVTDFTTGCSPGGCTYSFHIHAAKSANTPGFSTSCNGTDEQGGLKPCKNPNILSNIKPETYPKWEITVQHQWHPQEGSTRYATGSRNVSVPDTEPSASFTMKPTAEAGVE
ncbi:hypothetical protein N7474_011107 [Penicillium riverlandense]|uniref:uncharacterized protein n=1 Tax=Penicillium riverlandense TaxID=1903569 RepID=UPI002548A995|nr:uncharacterized protein N7474_011107 [Penicillium riverlandense]KAJ5805220.1 hypothetical protein N7474_011107 [Penicillium riverlandense]